MIKRSIFIFTALLIFWLPLNATAPSKPFYKQEQVALNKEQTFPVFRSKKTKLAQERINQYIQLYMLQTLLPMDSSNPPHSSAIEILTNTPALLSLSTQKEQEKNILHFNAQTGELLGIQDFFTPQGIAFIKRTIVKQNPGGDSLSPAEKKAHELSLKSDLQNFVIKNDSITIYHRSNPTDNAASLDSTSIAAATLNAYLSEAGNYLIHNAKPKRIKKLSTIGTAGLYKGLMDQKPVVILIEPLKHKHINGILYLVHNKTSVILDGPFKNNRINQSTQIGQLQLTISSGQIVGQIKQGNKTVHQLQLTK